MAKGLIILNNGFEDTEGLTTIDVLRRAKIDMDIVALHDVDIVSQSGIKLHAEYLIKDVKLDSYDFLVIPGGGAVFKFLHKEKIISDVITKFVDDNKLVATICAAPSLVGKLGYFKGKKYTCFPGCNDGVEGIYTGHGVEITGNFITAKSMAYSIDFALEIIKFVLGKEKAKEVEKSIYAK